MQINFIKNLIQQTVTIHLGAYTGFSDTIKGQVVEVESEWLKMKTKNSTEIVRISAITRISQKS